MDQQQIKAFIDAMAASDLDEMEFSEDGWTLRLVRRAKASALSVTLAASAAPVTPSLPASAPDAGAMPPIPNELTAPLHGVVHLQQSPGDLPFLTAGQLVKAGQTVCVIEAMKVFNEVCAERDATLAAVLVADGQEVEAGQPMFRFA